MDKLIFTCMAPSHSPGLDIYTPLFAASIRMFGGILSECPVWVLIPQFEDDISEETRKLVSLDVTVIPFKIDPDVLKFPFAGYVRAAATAESLAKGKTKFLAWIGLDTVVINEPALFLLDKSKIVGFRPVHHTVIGSIYEEPLDPFWELIYYKCHVSEDKIFPMKTHVDHNTLRPYFNAGHLIVRPEKCTLCTWWDYFKRLHRDPCFEEYYKRDELYSIFFHQAILTGVILSTTKRQELQELPFTYNYPLHLYDESPHDLRPQNFNDLVTARYEEPDVLKTISFHDPFKSWLTRFLSQRR